MTTRAVKKATRVELPNSGQFIRQPANKKTPRTQVNLYKALNSLLWCLTSVSQGWLLYSSSTEETVPLKMRTNRGNVNTWTSHTWHHKSVSSMCTACDSECFCNWHTRRDRKKDSQKKQWQSFTSTTSDFLNLISRITKLIQLLSKGMYHYTDWYPRVLSSLAGLSCHAHEN